MKEKKNIDKLFNESFKNYEASPSPRVWENIRSQLNKDQTDRKVIPLWVRLGGIAALLALLLTVGNWVFTPFDPAIPDITNENVNSIKKENQENIRSLKDQKEDIKIASEENERIKDETTRPKASESDSHKTRNKSTGRTGISTASTYNNYNSKENKDSQKDSQIDNQVNGIAVTDNIDRNDADRNQANDNLTKIKSDTEEVGIAEKELRDSDGNLNNEVEAPEKTVKKKSILEAIAEQNSEAIASQDKKQKPEHRWNVSPNIAPVYYSSLGNGSSIDPDLSGNPQKGDVNVSYGVQVSYAINDRLSLRTGVSNVDLSYSTSDIIIGTGPPSLGLRSVDYGSKETVVTAINKKSLTSNSPSNNFGELTLKSGVGDARVIQSITYFEVPLELKYALINSKFGINLIGGVSTLFLGDNEISVKSDNFSSVLGEANNLSNVSFSTNLGLGLDYKLSKRFTFNVEPMFKYQLNPYTDSAVDFKPYYLGVYSGLSFKF